METLNLNKGGLLSADVALSKPLEPPLVKVNPTVAWLLSLLIPGTGQLYLKKNTRGLVLFLFTAAAAWITFQTWGNVGANLLTGFALRLLVVFYIFAPLDAFYTGREINQGSDPWMHPNARVAALLNLTTRGFGYFYCGERTKGIIVWIAVGVMDFVVLGHQDWGMVHVGMELLLIVLAVDAYRIAKRQVSEVLTVPSETYPIHPEVSGMSAALPLSIAAFFVFNYFLLATLGIISLSFRHIDQSQSTVVATNMGGHTYQNPVYRVNIGVPPNWQPQDLQERRPGSAVLFAASTEDGACNIQVTIEPLMPWVSLEAFGATIERELAKDPRYSLEGERPAILGARAAREIRTVAKFPNALVQQHYVVTRRGIAAFALIETMNANQLGECEADLEQIEQQFDLR